MGSPTAEPPPSPPLTRAGESTHAEEEIKVCGGVVVLGSPQGPAAPPGRAGAEPAGLAPEEAFPPPYASPRPLPWRSPRLDSGQAAPAARQ